MTQTVTFPGWLSTGTGRRARQDVDVEVQQGVIVGPGGAGDAIVVVNKTGATLARDALVYVTGVTDGVAEIDKADANVDGAAALFYLPNALLNGATGLAYTSGLSVATLNTDAAGAVDDPVYLSETAGGWTLTAPTAANSIIQIVGRVAVKSATVGQIMWTIRQGGFDVSSNDIQTAAVTTAKLADSAVTGPKLTDAAFGLQGVAAVEVDHAAASPFEIAAADATHDRVALVYIVATEAAAGAPDVDIGTAGTIDAVVNDFKAGAWVVGDRLLNTIRVPAGENVRATIAAAGTAGKLDVYVHVLTPVAQTANIADDAVTGAKIPNLSIGSYTNVAVEVDHAAASPFEILAADATVDRIIEVWGVATEAAAGEPDIDVGCLSFPNAIVDDFGAGAWGVGDRFHGIMNLPMNQNLRATIGAAGTAGKIDVYFNVATMITQASQIANGACTAIKIPDAALGVVEAATIVLDHADGSPVELLAANATQDRLVTVMGTATEAAADGPDIDVGGVSVPDAIINDVAAGAWPIGYRFTGTMLLPKTEALRATIAAAGTAGAFNLYIRAQTIIVSLANFAADVNTWLNGVRSYLADGMAAIATITVSAAPATSFKTTTTAIFRLAGIHYSKAAEDPIAFTAADTINVGTAVGSYWGVWLVQCTAAGVVSTKSPAADQVYASEAAAIAALPAVDADNVQLGYITVEANADVAWTANGSTLTVAGGAGNCQARTFYDLPAPATLPAAL